MDRERSSRMMRVRTNRCGIRTPCRTARGPVWTRRSNTAELAGAGAGSALAARCAAPVLARSLGLSAKLLLLTILFVMLAEVLIFVPSVANFRINWLNDRLTAAQLASLAAEASPNGDVPQMLRNELLRTAQVQAVALKRNDQRQLILNRRHADGHRCELRPVASPAARASGVMGRVGADLGRARGPVRQRRPHAARRRPARRRRRRR